MFLKPHRTVKSIPPKLRLGFARVFLQALDTVLACPSDISVRVQLLILPCCVLGTFLPKNRAECRSGMRECCQFDSISSAISRWRDPGDKLCLILDCLAGYPLCDSVKKVYNLEGSNLYQCKRKLGDGHFTVAIKMLSLDSKHLFAPPPVLPSISCHGEALV